MRVAVFSSQPYDRAFFAPALKNAGHDAVFLEERLTLTSAGIAQGFPAICAFVNDDLGKDVIGVLAGGGTRLVAMRCAGFNNVDLPAAAAASLAVVRVPAYSPYAVAEHAIGLMLALNRKLHRAYLRVREGHFGLNGLLGFDMHGRTTGIVGTGQIGAIVCRILTGFGCQLLASDPVPIPQRAAMGVRHVPVEALLSASDIITLHCPLTSTTYHLVGAPAVEMMKPGVMVINTGRGGLIDARAAIVGLKSGRIGALGLDVYEEESELFFRDLSDQVIQDDVFARLLTFPNVLVTAHQGFFTQDALRRIAETTAANLSDFAAGRPCPSRVAAAPHEASGIPATRTAPLPRQRSDGVTIT